MDLKSTLLLTGGSAGSFKLLNAVIRVLPTPQPAQRKAWKWRNVSTSLAHSCLTGAGAVLCFYRHPQMMEDLISFCSMHSHSLVAVSTGYFIHDFLDMALNQPFKQSWDLLLHHSLVISCFGLAVTSRLYLGFAAVSLLVEINSVFLHLRQLLILSGRRNKPGTELTAPQPSLAYSITSWLNLGTFLVFRACTLGWMSRWLARHSEHIPRYVLMMGAAGLSLISTMNVAIFYKMFKADILKNMRNTTENH
ncbi:TLC domain-containing protein 2-like [Simochromis diagramma]|uniref:TLC domain-containing protein 2-like n=1 Tax=Simochromis diagramma TaxID=43689 RepID=UPI001A7EF6DB|nr:TLC domain-containing protein 2-like [Simochromis diagramma]